MLYRRFGKTGISISAFSLGTMRLVKLPQEQAESVLNAGLQAGINHIETAQAYGSSEVMLGGWLAGVDRSRLHLTTKISPSLAPDRIRPALEGSLQRLGVSYLDGIALHGINLPEHLESALRWGIPALQQAQAEGLVRHIGFSTHAPLDLIEQAIATEVFAFVNLHYYYFRQRNAPALAAAHDLGVFIISPADKGGMLYQPPPRLVQLCQPLSPLQFGYRFLLEDPRVHTLSVGPETPAELTEALASLECSPPIARIQDRLEAALRAELGSDRCAQCHACLPCPVGIQIPEVLRLRNLSVAYDMQAYGQYRYNMFGQAGHWFPGQKADHCTECGDCLPRCPEQLDIPRLLFDTHARLNQDPIRRLWESSRND